MTATDESIEEPAEEVNAAQVETLGHRYLGRKIRLSRCQFICACNGEVPSLLRSQAFRAGAIAPDPEGWIGFMACDSGHRLLQSAFAPITTLGDVITTLRPDTRINLTGRVVELGSPHYRRFGLICESITREE